MKKYYVNITIFISAIIGASFSFVFLFYTALEEDKLSNLVIYTSIINNFLFFGSLLLILLAFLYKKSLKFYYGIVCIIFGFMYFFHIFTFSYTNYYYFIPLSLYVISGYLSIINK